VDIHRTSSAIAHSHRVVIAVFARVPEEVESRSKPEHKGEDRGNLSKHASGPHSDDGTPPCWHDEDLRIDRCAVDCAAVKAVISDS
jgi:hypothetical protein